MFLPPREQNLNLFLTYVLFDMPNFKGVVCSVKFMDY
jgi:hypothetical protein